MSRGILQLAATGRLPLHLEYRMLTRPVSDLPVETKASEDIDPYNTPIMSSSFEFIYGEY